MIAEKVSVRLCHHHNLFSFDQNFLKPAAKMNIDKILDQFENWPDRIIYFRVKFPGLLKKKASVCHYHNLFSFDQIYLKLADKVDMDGISDELKTSQIEPLI